MDGAGFSGLHQLIQADGAQYQVLISRRLHVRVGDGICQLRSHAGTHDR